MEGGFQDERVGLLQWLQCPDALPGLPRVPRPGGELWGQPLPGLFQQCRRLPGKIGVCPGGFLAKAGQIFLRRLVDRAKSREGGVAQAVAGVVVPRVRLVRHPALPAGHADSLRLCPGQAQQRAAVAGAFGADAPCPVQPGAPGQPEQQRLCLVTCSMGRRNAVYPLLPQLFKTGVAEAAGPILPGMGRHRKANLRRAEDPQRQTQLRAGLPHKSFVPVGRLPPQAVVDMADTQHKAGLCL